MDSENYKKFCFQLDEVIKLYPFLSIKEKNGVKFLKGILDILNDKSAAVGSYLIEIYYSDGFPYRFPILFETGGDIPNEANWHKYTNGACCLTVKPDEILKCKHGVTLYEFIQKYCTSYFANHLYRKATGTYLNGEYSHGILGLKEFYIELFRDVDFEIWYKCFKCTFLGKRVGVERNNLCFCGSTKKFKQCHLKVFDSLRDIGFKRCLADIKSIYPKEFFNKVNNNH